MRVCAVWIEPDWPGGQWKLQGRMFSTFDRYLIWRVLHTFAMLFIATYGLFVVIDLFMNIDEFQENSLKGLAAGESGRQLELFRRIGVYYLYHAFDFFELAGSILVVVSAIAVLALIRKSSETFPLLAAGVPAFRLLRPLLITTAGLNLLLVINQELVIPHLAVQLQTPRGSQIASVQQVEPVYDYSNYMMHISGDQVLLDKRLIVGATFAVNATELSSRPFVMKAERARYVKDRTRSGRSGWLLEDLTAVLDSQILTAAGRKRITPSANGRDAFVESDVTFEQLYNRGRNMRLLSSWELVQQIQNPSTGLNPLRARSLALHSRMTRPLLSLLSVTIALPLVLRRESSSLIANMALCAGVQGCFFGLAHVSLALGGTGVIEPDLAAWLPVILNGMASTWTSNLVQT